MRRAEPLAGRTGLGRAEAAGWAPGGGKGSGVRAPEAVPTAAVANAALQVLQTTLPACPRNSRRPPAASRKRSPPSRRGKHMLGRGRSRRGVAQRDGTNEASSCRWRRTPAVCGRCVSVHATRGPRSGEGGRWPTRGKVNTSAAAHTQGAERRGVCQCLKLPRCLHTITIWRSAARFRWRSKRRFSAHAGGERLNPARRSSAVRSSRKWGKPTIPLSSELGLRETRVSWDFRWRKT